MRLNNSKSGIYFCCREHKDLAQRIDFGLKEIQPNHYGNAVENINNYRKNAFRYYSHNIDENRNHNELSNLIILCLICHRKLSSHKYKLINKEQIILC